MPARGAADHVAEREAAAAESGLSQVAAVSFLAARAAPSAGFLIALAGGVALSRAGERDGMRRGYGASIAAMLQSIAILGPARLGVPLTQALSAPLLGRMWARGATVVSQIAVCVAIRGLENALATALFIWVIVGGLDAYAGTYDAVLEWLPLLPSGPEAALGLTVAVLIGWTLVGSTVQVLVYRRGLARWGDATEFDLGEEEASPRESGLAPSGSGRFDPRAVAVAATIAFALLLASTAPILLAGVAAWLILSTLAAGRLDRGALPAGLALAALLAGSALAFGLVGGLGAEVALRRGARAGLLVVVATWLRAVAGPDGLREVARRALRKLAPIPATAEASRVLDDLGSAPRLMPAARSLLAVLRKSPKRLLPLLDAVTAWVAIEARRFRAAPAAVVPDLGIRARDAVLVGFAAAPLGPLLLVPV